MAFTRIDVGVHRDSWRRFMRNDTQGRDCRSSACKLALRGIIEFYFYFEDFLCKPTFHAR
jgi:hypothetical protein